MNSIASEIAKGLKGVYFGQNWTSVNYSEVLNNVSFDEAVKKIEGFHSIATLFFHAGYYVKAVLGVLEGGPLDAKDSYSFDLPPLQTEGDWLGLKEQTYERVRRFAAYTEELTDHKLDEIFVDQKYGNYYRNLTGVVEHAHYHLGQIVFLKKWLRAEHS